jgi:exopolysaccharide production protein ExoZ
MYSNLQGPRAFAALGVVVFHLGLLPATSLPFQVGASGVDLFFVLSGFIIPHSASGDARFFLARRLLRVLPAYWIATALAALFAWPALGTAATADWLVQSLLYLPGPGGRPVLIFVAWTLLYELAFYLMYWVPLRLGAGRAPFAALPVLVLLALVPVPGTSGPWPLLLEFAIGIAVFLLTRSGRAGVHLSAGGGLLIASAGLVLLAVVPRLTGYDPNDYQSLRRVFSWGVPAGMVVIGLVAAENCGAHMRSRLILLLGAASYAIYLLHPIVVGQLLAAPAYRPPVSWALCVLATFITAGAAVLFHLMVEVPFLRTARASLAPRSLKHRYEVPTNRELEEGRRP